jgi:hypothetical protein
MWHDGARMNLRTHAGCMLNNGNRVGSLLLFTTSCPNRQDTGWWLDPDDWKRVKFPVDDGVKFTIRSQMAGGRAVFFVPEFFKNNNHIIRIMDY